MTDQEREQDELVLAKIIAGAESSGRKMAPNRSRLVDGNISIGGHHAGYGDNYGFSGPDGQKYDGPCCAVGMGLLYADVEIVSDAATKDFARAHDVSESYAVGVSAGFEGTMLCIVEDIDAHKYSPDFARGFSVGEAAFDYLAE